MDCAALRAQVSPQGSVSISGTMPDVGEKAKLIELECVGKMSDGTSPILSAKRLCPRWSERLRCKGCGRLFTAAQPEGMGPEKGGATTSAMIAQLRYGSAVPFKRLERLQANQGIPLLTARNGN